MSIKLPRRAVLAGAAMLPLSAHAATRDDATIGWPNDVASWDPNQRFTPDAQSIFKAVFDSPLTQNEKLELVGHAITKWEGEAHHRGFPLHLPRSDQDHAGA